MNKIIVGSFLLILLAVDVGCSVRTATLPDGRVLYSSKRFGTKEQIKRVEFRGSKGEVFILEGYAGDQVEALGVVTEAAVKGAVSAAVPGAGLLSVPAGFKLAPKDDPSTPKLEIE